MKHLAALTLLSILPAFAACQRDAPPPAAADTQAAADASTGPKTALGRTVARAMDEARKDLREGNLSLNGDYDVKIGGQRIHRKASKLPAAEITPEGDLVVSGRTLALDERARGLARDYREGIIAIAEAGMDLGVQGADLGMKAAGDAIASLFRGDMEEMEKRIEAEARQIEASAVQLCDRLPALFETQQALAAAVPEFAPYATMETSDFDDCRKRHDADGGAGDATASAVMDAAAEADAAADAAAEAIR